MFDQVESELPLPDGYIGALQSKDFDCSLSTILLRADGRLMCLDRTYEVDPERKSPEANDTRQRLFGLLNMVSEEWRDLDFHGDFRFYGLDHASGTRHEYRARYTHGNLEWIKLIDQS